MAFFLLFVFLWGVCAGLTDRIRLRNVETLTFHRDLKSGSSNPELLCVGGSAMNYPEYHPCSVQCYNRGFDGYDVQWECKAELDKKVRFGNTFVNCQGYSYLDDEYVKAGSCKLEYELEFVGRKQPSFFNFPSLLTIPHLRISPYVPLVIFVVLAFAIWYFCLRGVVTEYHRPLQPPDFDTRQAPVEPSAPPDYPPPSYEDTVRGGSSFSDYSTRQRYTAPPPHYGWNIPSSERNCGSSRLHPKTSPEASTSWLRTGLAAGAGFLGGYFFGSADRHSTQTFTTRTTRRNRLYPEFICTEPEYGRVFVDSTPSSSSDRTNQSGDQRDSYVATTFAKTKRH